MRKLAQFIALAFLAAAGSHSAHALEADEKARIGALGLGLLGAIIKSAQAEKAKQEWEKVNRVQLYCVDAFAQRDNLSLPKLIERGITPSDARLQRLMSVCSEFANRKLRQNFDCTLPGAKGGQVRTKCNEQFSAFNGNDHYPIGLKEAIDRAARRQQVNIGKFESEEGRTERERLVRIEAERKARIAREETARRNSERLARLEEERKERARRERERQARLEEERKNAARMERQRQAALQREREKAERAEKQRIAELVERDKAVTRARASCIPNLKAATFLEKLGGKKKILAKLRDHNSTLIDVYKDALPFVLDEEGTDKEVTNSLNTRLYNDVQRWKSKFVEITLDANFADWQILAEVFRSNCLFDHFDYLVVNTALSIDGSIPIALGLQEISDGHAGFRQRTSGELLKSIPVSILTSALEKKRYEVASIKNAVEEVAAQLKPDTKNTQIDGPENLRFRKRNTPVRDKIALISFIAGVGSKYDVCAGTRGNIDWDIYQDPDIANEDVRIIQADIVNEDKNGKILWEYNTKNDVYRITYAEVDGEELERSFGLLRLSLVPLCGFAFLQQFE